VNPADRLIIALDVATRDQALRIVDQLHGLAGVFKVGLQAFTESGPDLVREIVARGETVFLDLKLHDIPNTVEKAAASAQALGVSILTVHAAGGAAMMRAARSAAPQLRILGVTILTSLSESDLASIGFAPDLQANVLRLARSARASDLAGVIASPREISAIREVCGHDFLIVTPGIRSSTDPAGDQQRTLSARAAIQAGADYIVVGRPITAAPDPRAAAQRILDELS
jgi:orotidine-5'-phosphate decarboxylase